MAEGPAFTVDDRAWMEQALALAARAEAEGEVPVGAVVTDGQDLLGSGWNRNIALHDPSAHAEIIALREAGRKRANHRMPGCVLYVTLEPCAMCVSAVIHARLDRVVFGAADPKTGALGGAFDLAGIPAHNHAFAHQGGLCADRAATLLRDFFRSRRRGGS
jgi:tRNA(Arg) A34 adenosine deaminase TadA